MLITRYLLSGPLMVVLLAGLATWGTGCGGDDCGDCSQGCCREGQCVPLESCGSGDTGPIGPGLDGTTPGPTPQPQPQPQPQPSESCEGCTGCCDQFSGQCVAEGAGCAADGSVCRSGRCETVEQPTCPACNTPWQCVDGRCIGPVELCQQKCDGCCDDKGKCIALGGSQSSYACGKGGEQCMDCSRSGQVCQAGRGVCALDSGGRWEVCPIRALVDRSFVDCGWTGDKAPDIYLEYRLGGTTMKTRAVQAMDKSEGWEGAWVDSCVEVDEDVAGLDGMTVVAKDSDMGACGDVFDDLLGSCVLYTDPGTLADHNGFIRVGTTNCRDNMVRLDLKFRPLPSKL